MRGTGVLDNQVNPYEAYQALLCGVGYWEELNQASSGKWSDPCYAGVSVSLHQGFRVVFSLVLWLRIWCLLGGWCLQPGKHRLIELISVNIRQKQRHQSMDWESIATLTITSNSKRVV